MAAPITTEAGWRRLAIEQLIAEGRVRREGKNVVCDVIPPQPVFEMIDARVQALRDRESCYPAAYDAMVHRHAQERNALDAQTDSALAQLRAQIAEAQSALKLRHGAERRAFAANRHNVTTPEG